MAGFSGANLVHDVGFIDSAMTGSLSMLAMSDEIIGMVDRVVRGLPVSAEALALDVIDAVGPGGKFVAEPHTASSFRSECFFPSLIDRSNVQNWKAAGSQRMGERIDARVREILADHRAPELEDDVKQQFEQILAAAVARGEGGCGDAG
jgi:trimethylamine--corrinoid protein Co-methyltransferase